ncbi:MAG: DNA-3-methyladenine glycosylase, partial [Caldilineae bacterium]
MALQCEIRLKTLFHFHDISVMICQSPMTKPIQITVRLGEPLRRAAGTYRLQMTLPASATVADLLHRLGRDYPGFGERFSGRDSGHPYPYRIYINHRPLEPAAASEKRLQDGDLIHIVLPVAGGRGDLAPLPAAFYGRSALEVAPELLGCYLIRDLGHVRLVGRIVEVEAYLGREDAASHAYRGPTPRSRVMFGPAGRAYVYFIYGAHHCLNVVTGAVGEGQAILIRALEPLEGLEEMKRRRRRQAVEQLANGPGKLCQAFAIDRSFSGHDLTRGQALWLARGEEVGQIYSSPRVGVRGDSRALQAPWRFYVPGSPCVSPTALNA